MTFVPSDVRVIVPSCVIIIKTSYIIQSFLGPNEERVVEENDGGETRETSQSIKYRLACISLAVSA